MLNLIKMDFKIYKFNVILIFVYSIWFSMFFERIMSGTVSMLCVYIVVMSAFATEETNKIHLLHKSLPVTSREIVGAKYAEAAVVWLLSMATCVITSFVAIHAKHQINMEVSPFLYNSVLMITLQFALTMLITDIMIPLFYKFGYARGRVFLTVVWIAAAFLIPTAAIGIETTLNHGIICAAALFIVFIATAVSYSVSVKIYKRI